MAAKPPKRWTPQYIKRTHTKHRVRYGVRVPKRPYAHLIRFRGCRRRHMCTNRAPLRRARAGSPFAVVSRPLLPPRH